MNIWDHSNLFKSFFQLEKIESLPKFEEMTVEMFNYYFPETAFNPDRPTFWPHLEEQQPYNPDFKYYK